MLTGEQRGAEYIRVCVFGFGYGQVSLTWHLTQVSCVRLTGSLAPPCQALTDERRYFVDLIVVVLRGNEGGRRESDTLFGPGVSSVMVLTEVEVGSLSSLDDTRA